MKRRPSLVIAIVLTTFCIPYGCSKNPTPKKQDVAQHATVTELLEELRTMSIVDQNEGREPRRHGQVKLALCSCTRDDIPEIQTALKSYSDQRTLRKTARNLAALGDDAGAERISRLEIDHYLKQKLLKSVLHAIAPEQFDQPEKVGSP